ncbi:MAG: SDR family oxidoreductase [Mycobacteriaceae bacterium]
MTIAITGATGHLGTLVVEALLERTSADNIVALARDTAKAQPLADRGVTVRHFDYSQPHELTAALDGVDRLLLVSGTELGARVEQHRAVIDAAVSAGVGFVAYTSFFHTDTARVFAAAPDHAQTEELLAAAPVEAASLRNTVYTEAEIDLARSAVQTGTLVTSAGEGRVSSATRQDLAEAAAVVLTDETPVSGTYELSGDTSWDMNELAAAIGEVTGRTVTVSNLNPDEHRKVLADADVPDEFIGFLVGADQSIAAGELFDPSPGTLSGLIGRPTTTLTESLEQELA